MTRHDSNRPIVYPSKPAYKAITLAREYLQAHYADDIALKDVAKICGLSRFQVCRMFKQTFGLTPMVYQTQLRIDSAKKLLAKGFSVVAVATATGFYDQSHFGRYFKRLVGTTPGNYAAQTAISSYPSPQSLARPVAAGVDAMPAAAPQFDEPGILVSDPDGHAVRLVEKT